jgi:uncharacterized protein (TIGR00661 family)
MARIVYGVSGEGSGHSSRARVVLEHLTESGHAVKVVTYGRGVRHLAPDFDLFETIGLHIASVNNRVSPLKTLLTNLQKLPDGHRTLNALREDTFKAFAPEVVITDFEPMCAYLAYHYDLPLITIDNQHRLRYMHYDYPPRLKNDRNLTVAVIRAMVPKPDVSLITTFFFDKLKNQRAFLFPPLIRKEVRALKSTNEGHILVYLTSGFEQFVEMLKQMPRERFVIYGHGTKGTQGNLTFKEPSTDGFLQDLAACKAVMATAGFTLITESLHLKKPYLALPMSGQFEQAVNAIFLEQLKCGVNLEQPSLSGIGDFLYRLPEFEDVLSAQTMFDNSLLLTQLDALLEDDAKLAGHFHRNRKSLGKHPEADVRG